MKLRQNYLPVSLLLSLLGPALIHAAEINLGSRAGVILRTEVRMQVLELSQEVLEGRAAPSADLLGSVYSPFSFERIEEVAAKSEEVDPEPVAVVYDDASVLQLVAQSFAGQVRGTIMRGSVRYLQLQGGALIQKGATFPVSLPQGEGQSFTVNVKEITGSGYTLGLGEAEQVVPLGGLSSGSGARFSN